VGIGLPNLACNLARRTHAPNLVLIYESGAVGATPSRLPVSIGDPALVTGSLMVCGMADVFQLFLAKRTHRGRFSRRGAGGSTRQHQHHRHRPYERPRFACQARARGGNRDSLPPWFPDRLEALATFLSRAGRFRTSPGSASPSDHDKGILERDDDGDSCSPTVSGVEATT